MKLAIYFGLDTVPYVVTWDKSIVDVPPYFYFDNEYWQGQMRHDTAEYFGTKGVTGVDWHILYTKMKAWALPININGVAFPVPDFKALFRIVDSTKKCECGAETAHGKNTGHATWCPKWSKY
jgi:hypothetical protein